MRVSLAVDLAPTFAETKLCFPPRSSARRAASGSFDGAATGAPIGAARFGDRHSRGASLLPRPESTPL
jgi:hypothetical protein